MARKINPLGREYCQGYILMGERWRASSLATTLFGKWLTNIRSAT
jgi:hypothetical protein